MSSVESGSPVYSVFRLEDTLFNRAWRHAAIAVKRANGEGPSSEQIKKLGDEKLQRYVLGWCIGKSPEDLAPAKVRLANRTRDKVKRWAGLVMKTEVEDFGHEIGVHSARMPLDFVESFTYAIEDTLDIDVTWFRGAEMETNNGLYTGRLMPLNIPDALDAEEDVGAGFSVVADRNEYDLWRIRNGSHHVLVKPGSGDEPRQVEYDMDIINTDQAGSNLSLRKAGSKLVSTFNLGNQSGQQAFLENFYQ